MNVFFHQGDLGDIIAFLPVMRHLGGGQLILGNWMGVGAREPMSKERFEAIAPLLEKQPYINSISHEDDPKGVTHNTFNFRCESPMRMGNDHTLVNWIADFFKCGDVDLSPWITGVYPNVETEGKTIFARTCRYHNPRFDWRHATDAHPNCIVIGFQEEWRQMCAACGREIPWRQTSNLLEVAELIAGSELLISNQNVHFWIAAAMGHPVIQETDAGNLNSVIPYSKAQYFPGAYP